MLEGRSYREFCIHSIRYDETKQYLQRMEAFGSMHQAKVLPLRLPFYLRFLGQSISTKPCMIHPRFRSRKWQQEGAKLIDLLVQEIQVLESDRSLTLVSTSIHWRIYYSGGRVIRTMGQCQPLYCEQCFTSCWTVRFPRNPHMDKHLT